MRAYIAGIILIFVLVLLFILPRDILRRALSSLERSSHSKGTQQNEDTAALKQKLDADEALLSAYPAAVFSKPLRNGVIQAPVYAAYPSNYQQELLIGGGKEAGIEAGDAVLLETSGGTTGTIIGRVEEVFGTTARVKTIFDPSWRSAVRMGTSSIDALLEGGVTPRLTLVPKDASFLPGESVYNADQQFPYGLNIGKTGAVSDVSGGVFKEAFLVTPYDINTIRVVSILSHEVH